jgi:uncharacterized protein (TIGR00369 family)
MQVSGQIAFTIEEQSADRVLGVMPITAGILNPFGVAHAGAILWFADVCATVLVLGKTDASEGMKGFPLAINLSANLTANQRQGTFRALSVYVKKGRSVSVVRTQVLGDDDRLIAEVTTNHVLAT